MIQINSRWRIDNDPHQWLVQKRRSKIGAGQTEFKWDVECYATDLAQCYRYILNQEQKACTSLRRVIEVTQRFHEYIKESLSDGVADQIELILDRRRKRG